MDPEGGEYPAIDGPHGPARLFLEGMHLTESPDPFGRRCNIKEEQSNRWEISLTLSLDRSIILNGFLFGYINNL